MNIKQALEYAKDNSDIELLQIKRLLKKITKLTDVDLVIHSDYELKEEHIDTFKRGLKLLKKGYPLQYITNIQSFWGLDFYVDENVLIP